MEKQDITTNMEVLLPRYYEGQVTEEEKQTVERWLDESDENRRIARQVYMLYLATDTINTLKKVDTEKALSKVKSKMTDNKKTTWWEWAQRVAAVLFIPLLFTSILLFWNHDNQTIAQMIEVKTNPGMTTSLTLPDGTLVFLNSESSITYSSCFDGDTRKVELEGEAYFEVTKNPEKRFIVSTAHQSQIEVLGTSFNVEAYGADKKVYTTLVEGKVNFLFQKGSETKQIMIKPGQKLVYDSTSDTVQLCTTSCESETAWKEGKVVFLNTPFEDALHVLEKRYNVQFILKNNKLKKEFFTGTFTNQRLDKILEYFKISSHIRWHYLESSDIKEEKSRIEIY